MSSNMQAEKMKVSPNQTMVSLSNSYSHGAYVINEDLWAEIFKRILPIETLFRFSSVCKLWKCIISSFIHLHPSFTLSTTPPNLKPYLHVAPKNFDANLSKPNLAHEIFTLFRPLAVEHSTPQQKQLYFPFRADRRYGKRLFTFVDAIHGILCISYSWSTSYEPSSPSFNSALLWNPTIHKYVALPSLRLPHRLNAIGFGYDANTNDFKVVLIGFPSGAYHVYSDRIGLWRTKFESSSSSWTFLAGDRPCFVNGTIHWLISLSKRNDLHPSKYFVLMFDCESEEVRKINVPQKLFGPLPVVRQIEIFKYAGMLAALVNMVDRIDLWVMEEHGVSTSWKHLYMIPADCSPTMVRDPSFEKLAPYGPDNTWNKLDFPLKYCMILTDRAYEQTMVLMDHPKARSYTNQETVPILTEDP